MPDKNIHIGNMTNSSFVGGDVKGNVENKVTIQGASLSDLGALAQQLTTLRQTMMEEAKTADQVIAVGKIAEAEQAAQAKDAPKMMDSLKAAGQWALDVASRIGINLAVEVLKQALHL